MTSVRVTFGSCAGFSVHSEILTKADNPEEFSTEVYGWILATEHQHGYCRRCGLPFRWDVDHQEWVPHGLPRSAAAQRLEEISIIRSLEFGLYPFVNCVPVWHY